MKLSIKIISITLCITFIASLCSLFIPAKQVLASVETTDTISASAYVPNNGDIVIIKNKFSGKCLNVNYGTDANGTNVNQWTQDGSIEQKWKLEKSGNYWKIHAMCSSNGTNRVLDVLRTGGSSSGSIVSGNNVDIWAPNDPDAQEWIIWPLDEWESAYSYIMLGSADDFMFLTAYGTLNGSGAGTSSTSAGNVFISDTDYSNNASQMWEFIKIN